MAAFLDFAVLILTVVFGIMGARSGLIREVFRFAALIVGFCVSFLFYRDLQVVLHAFGPPVVTAVIAFAIIFLAVSLSILGLGLLARNLAESLMLGWVDHILGLTLGVLKAFIIAWAVCLSISSFPLRTVQEQFGRSAVYKMFKALPKGLSLESLENARATIRGKRPDVERDVIYDNTTGSSKKSGDKKDVDKKKAAKKGGAAAKTEDI